jgi:hypothetical protein
MLGMYVSIMIVSSMPVQSSGNAQAASNAAYRAMQVRSLVEVLPFIDVVKGDAFNSHPTDPKRMGPDALRRFQHGEDLEVARIRAPLVELPLGATEDRICGMACD